MASHQDPRLLYSIDGIRAYHLQDGDEQPLTPSGPQTLSLLMVPTTSPYGSADGDAPQGVEEDFYLHLNLPPELDLSLPATTQIYHQPPHSYLIPRWDMGPDSGAFTRIEFPPVGRGTGSCSRDDIDTFETILAQCTAFLEKAKMSSSAKGGLIGYNPQDYRPGEGYAHGTATGGHGEIVLVNEEDGSVLGELAEGAEIHEDEKLLPGRKDPVEIEVSPDGKHISVRPMSEDYLRLSRHPAYKDSSLVQNAAAASRLIVTATNHIGNMMNSGAETFASKTQPSQKPMNFTPAAHARVRKINNFTSGAATLSAKTVGAATKHAQNIGAAIARKGEKARKRDQDGYQPGFLNKSMIAFSTIADGIAYSGTRLLESTGTAATTVVGHKWGPDAGNITSQLAGGIRNVGLVYIDVTGVSRRAVIKSVAKGMVIGKVAGGGEIVVGGDAPLASGSGTKPEKAEYDRLGMGSNDGYGPVSGGNPGVYTNQTLPPYSPAAASRSGVQRQSEMDKNNHYR